MTARLINRALPISVGVVAVLAVAASVIFFSYEGGREGLCKYKEGELDQVKSLITAGLPQGTPYDAARERTRNLLGMPNIAPKGDKIIVDMLHQEKGPQTLYTFEQRCPVSDKNTNVWTVNMFVDGTGVLTASEVLLVFDDLDFKARRAAFRFSNFPDTEKMKAALSSFIGTSVTPGDVDQMMQAAGATRQNAIRRGGQTEYIYRRGDEQKTPSLWTRALFADPTPSAISWIFGADGRLAQVLVNGE